MTTPFVPKQMLPFDGALLEELQGTVSNSIAAQIIPHLPAITASSAIHDNGCGPGTVTEEIMATAPPAGFTIAASDINPMFLAQLKAKLAAHPNWPVTVSEDNAVALGFADATFTHSFSNFVFVGLPDPVQAAREILRTLKPGGTAAVSIWEDLPWLDALAKAHVATRGANAPPPAALAVGDWKGDKLRKTVDEAGWADVQSLELTGYLQIKDLKRWATIAWGFLGAPPNGWTQDDEDKWDEAVAFIVNYLNAKEAWHVEEGGEHKIKMVATVLTVTK
jgi:SAM-dependent methyltransferase